MHYSILHKIKDLTDILKKRDDLQYCNHLFNLLYTSQSDVRHEKLH